MVVLAASYQQSNQWAIETLALTRGARGSVARADTLHLSAFKRLGARVASANIAFYYIRTRLFSDRIETAQWCSAGSSATATRFR